MCAHLMHGVVVVVGELPIESQSTPPFYVLCVHIWCMHDESNYVLYQIFGRIQREFVFYCMFLGGYIYTIDIHTYIYMYKDCALGGAQLDVWQNC